MSIILRENEWAEEMIRLKNLGKKPSETLRIVARYYIDKGYKKNDVRKMLESFLLQCNSDISLPKWSNAIDTAIRFALKYKAVEIDNIIVSKTEMEKISQLNGIQVQRLAFTLLCLSKYWMIISQTFDGWVNNKDSEIMSLANINTSIKRQSVMYGQLKELGLIQFSKKIDNTNVKVLFADDGEEAMRLSNFKNLGYQYMMYNGSNDFIICQNCGATVKKNKIVEYGHKNCGRKQKYCKDCAKEIHIQQAINYAIKCRKL